MWDDRHWLGAQKSDKPVETYLAVRKSTKSQENIDDLDPTQQAWLRAT